MLVDTCDVGGVNAGRQHEAGGAWVVVEDGGGDRRTERDEGARRRDHDRHGFGRRLGAVVNQAGRGVAHRAVELSHLLNHDAAEQGGGDAMDQHQRDQQYAPTPAPSLWKERSGGQVAYEQRQEARSSDSDEGEQTIGWKGRARRHQGQHHAQCEKPCGSLALDDRLQAPTEDAQ